MNSTGVLFSPENVVEMVGRKEVVAAGRNHLRKSACHLRHLR
jgi:hypothetical protein